MNMFEEALALNGTIKMCALTQGQIAKRLGVSQSYIANKLRLLNFSPRMQEKILEYGLCERQARALLRIRDERLAEGALCEMAKKNMTVSESEALVDALLEKEEIRAPKHSDLDHALASCLSLLRLYTSVSEHRVTEEGDEVVLTVRMGR
jgi:ParB family chromosome partitioning protein